MATAKRPTYVGPYFDKDDLAPMAERSASEHAKGMPDRQYDAKRGRFSETKKPKSS